MASPVKGKQLPIKHEEQKPRHPHECPHRAKGGGEGKKVGQKIPRKEGGELEEGWEVGEAFEEGEGGESGGEKSFVQRASSWLAQANGPTNQSIPRRVEDLRREGRVG